MRAARVSIFALTAIYAAAIVGPWLSPYAPAEQDRNAALAAPSSSHWLGTDGLGRDQLTRLLSGGRLSLAAGLLAAGLSLAGGILLGGLAGFYGGWRDTAIMRCAELFLALPWLYLLLGMRAFLPLSISPGASFLLVVCLLGTAGWARPARLIRGVILSAKEREYVYAARAFGGSDWYLLRRHILPETRDVIWTQAALLIPRFITAEVTLSFLGLGVGEPQASWGNMLAALRDLNVLASAPWMLAPAVALFFVTLAHQQIGSQLKSKTADID